MKNLMRSEIAYRFVGMAWLAASFMLLSCVYPLGQSSRPPSKIPIAQLLEIPKSSSGLSIVVRGLSPGTETPAPLSPSGFENMFLPNRLRLGLREREVSQPSEVVKILTVMRNLTVMPKAFPFDTRYSISVEDHGTRLWIIYVDEESRIRLNDRTLRVTSDESTVAWFSNILSVAKLE